MSKVQFNYSQLNQDGLREVQKQLVPIRYAFCFPSNINYVDKVMAIDKTLVVYNSALSQNRCPADSYLGVGNTGQVDFREVLRQLTELDYIHSIREVTSED